MNCSASSPTNHHANETLSGILFARTIQNINNKRQKIHRQEEKKVEINKSYTTNNKYTNYWDQERFESLTTELYDDNDDMKIIHLKTDHIRLLTTYELK